MVLELVRRERSKNDNKISGLEKCAWRFSSLRLRMQGRYCGGEKGKCDMDSVLLLRFLWDLNTEMLKNAE
jgi:hypothetical protein